MRVRTSVGAVVVAVLMLGTSPAWSADLTGVWFGHQECDRYDGQKFHTKYPDDVMLITQQGNQMSMAALLIDGDGFALLFQGVVIDDAKEPDKKAQTTFTECATTPTSLYQETGRANKVELKKHGDGRFEATSIFLQVAQDSFPTDTGTCTWRYRRVDTEDPNVPTCAEVPAPTGPLQAQGAHSPRRR
jgi:hypothetical protein